MAKPTHGARPAAGGGSRLTAEECKAIAAAGQVQELENGAKAQTRGARLLTVLAGKLRLVRVAGGRSLHTATLNAGECACVGAGGDCFFLAEGRTRTTLVDARAPLPPALELKAARSWAAVTSREARFLTRTALGLHGRTAYLSAYARDLYGEAQKAALESAPVRETLARIPRLPVYVTRLLSLLHDPEAAAEEIVECARQDPSLVAELLRYVNSAALGFDTKITDVSHAVMLLGFNRVAQIVVGMGVARTMPDTARFKEVLHRSIAVAHMAYEIARLARLQRPATVSTAALLGEVGGSLLMLIKHEHAGGGGMELFCDFLDPARLGALLLRHWNIPEEIWRPVELQRLPGIVPPAEIPEAHRETVAVLHLARLCDEYLAGKDDAQLLQGFAPDYLQLLPLPEKSVSALFNKHLARTLRKQKGRRVFSA